MSRDSKHPTRRRTRTLDGEVMSNAYLIASDGPDAGRKYRIKSSLVLGRSSQATITIDSIAVSRIHARISRKGDQFIVEDAGSKNGTFVNGVPIRRTRLVVGDEIRVGTAAAFVFTQTDPFQEEIRQRQRLEALGRLSAGVVHDLNNMLGAVSASADYVEQLPASTKLTDDDFREAVADVRVAARRAAELCTSLLEFARGDDAGRPILDVGELVTDLVGLIRRTFDRSIHIETAVQTGLMARCSPTELHQVLLNLCLNARDAMPQGGTLTIRVDGESSSGFPLEPGYLALRVADTGAGIHESTLTKVFDPFYTTKPTGMGFGIGLSTVRSLVEAHGGTIHVSSEVGVGTRFDVVLPRCAEALEVDEAGGVVQIVEAPPGGARVLLVDDEAVVRRSMRRILRQAGYRVVEASSGTEALEVLDQSEAWAAVVTDLEMPGLRGDELGRKVRQERPDLPIVVVSGHDPSSSRLPAGVPHLRKPCDRGKLLETLAQVIALEESVDTETLSTLSSQRLRRVVAGAVTAARGS